MQVSLKLGKCPELLTVKLSSTYTLGKLVNMIQEGCSATIKLDPGYSPLQIVACCTITKAGLARAIALASGGEWKKSGSEWRLQISPLTEMVAGCSQSEMMEMQNKTVALRPKLYNILKSGKLKLIADPAWTDPELIKKMVECGPVDPNSLSSEQIKYLNDELESGKKAYSKPNAPANINEIDKLTWNPAMKLIIATENTILCSEGITYK
jgi:hypothetical protein